jgi:ribosome-associated protein
VSAREGAGARITARRGADAQALVGEIARAASDRKARDIVEIDMRGLVAYTDCFVICTGGTERQTKAIHDAIAERLARECGVKPRRVEGLGERRWILMDYLDVIVHIFTPPTREFYRLESLWGEAPIRVLEDPGEGEGPRELARQASGGGSTG